MVICVAAQAGNSIGLQCTIAMEDSSYPCIESRETFESVFFSQRRRVSAIAVAQVSGSRFTHRRPFNRYLNV